MGELFQKNHLVAKLHPTRSAKDRVCDAFSEKLWEGVPQDIFQVKQWLSLLIFPGVYRKIEENNASSRNVIGLRTPY